MKKVFLLLFLLSTFLPAVAQDTLPLMPPQNVVPMTPANVTQITELLIDENLPGFRMYWSPDGKKLILWHTETRALYDSSRLDTPLLTFETRPEQGIAFSPDGTRLALAVPEGIQIIDLNSLQTRLIATQFPVGTLAFNPDSTVLTGRDNAVGPSRRPDWSHLYFWNVETGEQYGRLGYAYTLIQGPFAFVFTSRGLLTFFVDVHLWDYLNPSGYRDPLLRSKDEMITLIQKPQVVPPDAPIYDAVIYQNEAGEYALWLTADDESALFSTQLGAFEAVTAGVSGENFDEDGLPATFNGYAQLQGGDRIRALGEMEGLAFPISETGFVSMISPRQAAASSSQYVYDPASDSFTDVTDGTVYTADESEGVGRYKNSVGEGLFSSYYVGESRVPETLGAATFAQVFETVGSTLVQVVSDPFRLQITNFETGESVESPLGENPIPFIDLAVQPQAGLVAGLTEDKQVYLWDFQTGALLHTFELQYPGFWLDFNADGSLLLISGGVGLRYWGVPQ